MKLELKKYCSDIADQNRNGGLVLVTVLWIAAILILIAVSAARWTHLDGRLSIADNQNTQLRWAGRAGIETAMTILQQDYRDSDALSDIWSDNDTDFNDIMVGKCSFDIRVVDEAAKLNVNKATRDQLMELPEMTEPIADAILDWRDKDDTPKTAGVEGGYYQNLQYPYTIRNDNFKTIRELLLVRDITADLLYGEDTNFNSALDHCERDGRHCRPLDDADDELDKGWIEYLSCYSYDLNTDADGEKRVNINTESQGELEKKLNIKKSHAKWIVDNKPKSGGYKSIADIIDKNSPEQSARGSGNDTNDAEPLDLQTFAKIADKITITKNKRIRGRININTAEKVVLAAILGGGEKAEQLADSVISYRQTRPAGMQSIAEILNVEGIDVDTFKKIAESITTRSNVYTVYCFTAMNSNPSAAANMITEAVIDRTTKPNRILYFYQGISN